MKNFNFLTAILLFIIILSCSTKNRRNEEVRKQIISQSIQEISTETEPIEIILDSSFSTYIKLIPQIRFPLVFECSEGFPIPELNYDHPAIKKHNQEMISIIGKLYENDLSIGIIYGYPSDILYPIITIYDKNGVKIKDFELFELNNCVEDEGYSATTKGTITEELVLRTTTEVVKWDDQNNGRKDTIRTSQAVRIK